MPGQALLLTTLCPWHESHGARLVEFGGWLMPVLYSSIVAEHKAVRTGVGLFDISHMGRLAFDGPDAVAWIDLATTNTVARLKPGRIQYSLLVHDEGGVLDDVLVYRLPASAIEAASKYLLICNASNRDAVVRRLDSIRDGHNATMTDETLSTIMLAVQGPRSADVLCELVGTDLPRGMKYYSCAAARVLSADALISRTGYTGEDGFELVMSSSLAESAWAALLEAGREFGIRPCGLGARDTLRFEAAMPLYGHELDAEINPFEAGLDWAVKLDKGDFLGCEALRRLQSTPGRRRVGLAMEGQRIARQGYAVQSEGDHVGVVTSGTLSPTLGRSLAMALVDPGVSEVGTQLDVDLRGRSIPAEVVPLPFYRRAVDRG